VQIYVQNGAVFYANNGLNNPVFRFNYDNNCQIINVEINGNSSGQTTVTGILLTWDCTGFVVDGATIYNSLMDGVDFYGDTGYGNNSVINSVIYNCQWNGITLEDANGDYAGHNEVSHCGDVGITSYRNNCTIEYNYVHDMDLAAHLQSHWGIANECGGHATIRYNTITNTYCAIALSYDSSGGATTSPGYNTATNNIITGCQFGIATDPNAPNNTISNNTITNWDAAGGWGAAVMCASANNAVTGNTFIITNAQSIYAGVLVNSGVTGTSITGNNFIQCPNPKILDQGSGTVIQNNVGYP